jgi:hypothetical protein
MFAMRIFEFGFENQLSQSGIGQVWRPFHLFRSSSESCIQIVRPMKIGKPVDETYKPVSSAAVLSTMTSLRTYKLELNCICIDVAIVRIIRQLYIAIRSRGECEIPQRDPPWTRCHLFINVSYMVTCGIVHVERSIGGPIGGAIR